MRQILLGSSLFFDKAAILTDGKLEDLLYEKKKTEGLLGNIYKGRVMNILPGMNAAFVDIGLKRNAYLYIDALLSDKFLSERNIKRKEVTNIDQALKKGDEVMVQINREPIGEKNVSVTTDISLSGKYLALIPQSMDVSVSKKIGDREERQRLYGIGASIMGDNCGMVMRTHAKGKDPLDIKREYDMLLNVFRKIKREYAYSYAPKLLHRSEPLIEQVFQDHIDAGVDEIYTEDERTRKAVEELLKNYGCTGLSGSVRLSDTGTDIFDMFNVTKQIDTLFKRRVELEKGGSIYIDVTEAMTVIDVNSGSYTGQRSMDETALSINLGAVNEIARQVKLRNISGIIIIDFIDMKDKSCIDEVVEAMKAAFRNDSTQTSVVGMTKLNLMEITRKKDKDNFYNLMTEDCPCCLGSGRTSSAVDIAYRIENIIKKIKHNTSCEAVVLSSGMVMIKKIKDCCTDLVEKIEDAYGIKIYFKEDKSICKEEISLLHMGKRDYIERMGEHIL